MDTNEGKDDEMTIVERKNIGMLLICFTKQ